MRSMSKVLFWGIIFFGCFPALSAHSAQAPFSLHIDAPPSVSDGGDVIVDVTLTNTSSETLLVGQLRGVDQGELEYSVAVLDSSGNPVAETSYGRDVRLGGAKAPHASFMNRSLKPGETMNHKIAVNKIFDMTHPGEYSVQVRDSLPVVDDSNPSETAYTTNLRSNTITVLVAN